MKRSKFFTILNDLYKKHIIQKHGGSTPKMSRKNYNNAIQSKSQVQNLSQKNWLLRLRADACARVNFTLLMICIENPDSKKKCTRIKFYRQL